MMDIQTLSHSLGGFYRNGRGQAPCPICQSERRRDQNALSLSQQGDKILAYCFKSRCSFIEIARAAQIPVNSVGVDFEAEKQANAKQAEYQAAQLAKARSLWDAAKPITGSKAGSYLQRRAITTPLPDSLRFMPDLYHGPSSSWCCAMIANVEPTGGIHRTYFTKQGDRLQRSAKMMLGPCRGGAVRLSDGSGPLVVAEGVETSLSLLQMLSDRNPSVWAATSSSGMKGLNLPPDPHALIIGVDGDKAGREAANTLATKAIALGWNVSLMEAPKGQDWNDILVSQVAS